MEKVYIYHTNDVHSHLENWPKIRRFIQRKREEIQAEQQTGLVVDLGDFIDRSHPLTEATNGVGNIELMNQIYYDAVTIGNNEGIGNSKSQLNHLYDQANFDVVLGNLLDKTEEDLPSWARKWKVIQLKSGTKIGLFGLTAPYPLTYSPIGWNVLSAGEILPTIINQLKKHCDSMILLSHLGVKEDREIARQYPEIELIIGSHTHHLFVKGEQVGETLLAAAGKFGHHIGEICLSIKDGKVIKKEAKTYATKDLKEKSSDRGEVQGYLEKGHNLLRQQTVANLPFELSLKSDTPDSLMEITSKSIQKKGQTKVSILNSGLFLRKLSAGLVNRDDLHKCLPHPMYLINVTLNGSDLIRLTKEIKKNSLFLRNFSISGMGFRGKIFGEVYFEGMSCDKDTDMVYWLNEKVKEDKAYTFTTVDHLMFLPFFPTIELAGKIQLLPQAGFIRKALEDYLRTRYPIQ